MDMTPFRVPVRLRLEGQIVEITSLHQAITFLQEWPATRRGPVFNSALMGCDAARNGAMRIEEARKAFESFARITGLLANQTIVPTSVAAHLTTPDPTRTVPR